MASDCARTGGKEDPGERRLRGDENKLTEKSLLVLGAADSMGVMWWPIYYATRKPQL